MTEELILSEVHRLPENLKLEVLHFVKFLRQEQEQNQEHMLALGPRIFGISKGRYTLAPDFDAPLDDFKDYM